MNQGPTLPSGLPNPDPEAQAHSNEVAAFLLRELAGYPDGFMPFEHWMDRALYAPGLGYYAAGNTKFGSTLPTGDFTTAPELTPLFGATLARQCAPVLQAAHSTTVLEFGAGSGALAAALIPALRQLGIEPNYQILEVSADLRQRQQERLAGLNAQIQWLNDWPARIRGCVIANEVLDAMPATLFQWDSDGHLLELGVRAAGNAAAPAFEWATRPASDELQHLVSQRMPALPGYQSEINLCAEAWIRQLGHHLEQGLALLIDYGFPRREYYHPQRAEGTLMCHFRHHAHAQPLVFPGIQDITTHVDFTAMADAALESGLDVRGYTSQARFLLNAGLPALMSDPSFASDPQALSAVQKLVSEAEMGELFKVLALGRGVDIPLAGFMRGDRRDSL